MAAFNQYLRAIVSSIQGHDGERLAELLSLNNLDAKEAVFQRQGMRSHWEPADDVHPSTSSLYENRKDWSELVSAHVQMLRLVCTGETERACELTESLINPLTKMYREDKEGWLATLMIRLSQNIRAVAMAADSAVRRSGRKPAVLEACGSALQKIFSTAIVGSNPRKKRPVLEVVVTLFRVYFQLNTLHLCKNLIAAVDRLDFDIFPAPSRVTYMFFLGRLAIFDDRYEDAESALEYALKHCHRGSSRNKALVMYHLVPIKLILGQLPTNLALQKYKLENYAEIVQAMQIGNLQQLDAALELRQWEFIRHGTYLILEKLKLVVARRLLKKVYLLKAEKGNQLNLIHFQNALEFNQMPLEMDEVECLVSNLILRGYVKGYIAHSRHILVGSKIEPFPPLKSANVADLS